jgi:hypothetical protein
VLHKSKNGLSTPFIDHANNLTDSGMPKPIICMHAISTQKAIV